MQMLTSSSSSHRSIEQGQNQSGSASSERPGSRCTTSNEARMMQTTASSTFDDYGAGNGPNTSGTSSNVPTMSNDARMVQTIAPSSLLSDNDAVPTGSGTATFQNVKRTRTFVSSSSIGDDEPGGLEDGPMPSFYSSSPTGTQPQGMGGVMNLPLHETDQGLEGKGQATLSWSLSHYEWRMDVGNATMASQESNRLSQTTARSMKMGGVMPPSPERVGLVSQPTEHAMTTVMPLSPRSSCRRNDDMDLEAGMAVFKAILPVTEFLLANGPAFGFAHEE